MSKRIDDTNDYEFPPFDCVSGGERYRDWRSDLYRHGAGIVDNSGSSLTDHWSCLLCLLR